MRFDFFCPNQRLGLVSYLVTGLVALTSIGCGDTPTSSPKKSKTDSDRVAVPSKSVTEFAGGSAVRVAWVRTTGEDQRDTFVVRPIHQLVGFDSSTGVEHVIRPEIGNYRRPLITPDGQAVVYSDFINRTIYMTPWDGSEPAVVLAENALAFDVWRDPADGQVWVFAGTDLEEERDQPKAQSVSRFPIDDPTQVEKVWDGGPVNMDNFQVSKDGKTFSSLFPWPHAGIGNFETGEWMKTGRGCWPSLAPDGSGVQWIFDGPHQNVVFFGRASEQTPWKSWKVSVSDHPELKKTETYHPRFSNHPEIFGITGPYVTDAGDQPEIFAGGAGVEVWLGRFSPDLGKVAEWWKLTTNSVADFYPDVWVESGSLTTLDLAAVCQDKPEGKPAAAYATENWPGDRKGMQFIWQNLQAQNRVSDSDGKSIDCHLKLGGMAFYGRHHDLKLAGGFAEFSNADARRIIDRSQKTGEMTIELSVAPDLTEDGIDATFFRIGNTASGDFLRLVQKGSKAYLECPGLGLSGEAFGGGWLRWQKPMHLTVTIKRGHRVHIYVGGTDFGHHKLSKEIQFPASDEGLYMLLGGNTAFPSQPGKTADDPGTVHWSGNVERIAFYDRAFEFAEVDAHSLAITELERARTPIVRSDLWARLVKTQPIFDPMSLGNYTRAMVVYTYEVDEVAAGDQTLEGKRIQVAHWAVINSKQLGTFPRTPSDQRAWLQVEPFDQHPEIETERISEDVSFDLPLYYDVTVPLDRW